MNDPDDSGRNTPTDLAPPMGEARDTQPPGDSDDKATRAFMREQRIPGAPKLPSNFRDLAESELVLLYRTALGMHESLLGASGLLEQNRRNTVEDIAKVVDRGFDRVWERIAPRLKSQDDQIAALKDEMSKIRERADADRAEYERKFSEQQACLDAITETLGELEKAQSATAST
jgi:hypothetical protein